MGKRARRKGIRPVREPSPAAVRAARRDDLRRNALAGGARVAVEIDLASRRGSS